MAITAHSAYSPESMVFPNCVTLEVHSEHRISGTHIKETAVEEANKDENRQRAFNKLSLELDCDSVDVAPKIELGKSRNGLPTLRIGSATITVDNYLKKQSLIDHQEIRESLYQQELQRGKKLPPDAGLVTFDIPVEEVPERHRWVIFAYVLELLKLQKHDPKKHNYCVMSALLKPDQKVRILTRRLDGGVSTTTSLASASTRSRVSFDNEGNETGRPAAEGAVRDWGMPRPYSGGPSIMVHASGGNASGGYASGEYASGGHASGGRASVYVSTPKIYYNDKATETTYGDSSTTPDPYYMRTLGNDLPSVEEANTPAERTSSNTPTPVSSVYYTPQQTTQRVDPQSGMSDYYGDAQSIDSAYYTPQFEETQSIAESHKLKTSSRRSGKNRHNLGESSQRTALAPERDRNYLENYWEAKTVEDARAESPRFWEAFKPIKENKNKNKNREQRYHKPGQNDPIWRKDGDKAAWKDLNPRDMKPGNSDGLRFQRNAEAPDYPDYNAPASGENVQSSDYYTEGGGQPTGTNDEFQDLLQIYDRDYSEPAPGPAPDPSIGYVPTYDPTKIEEDNRSEAPSSSRRRHKNHRHHGKSSRHTTSTSEHDPLHWENYWKPKTVTEARADSPRFDEAFLLLKRGSSRCKKPGPDNPIWYKDGDKHGWEDLDQKDDTPGDKDGFRFQRRAEATDYNAPASGKIAQSNEYYTAGPAATSGSAYPPQASSGDIQPIGTNQAFESNEESAPVPSTSWQPYQQNQRYHEVRVHDAEDRMREVEYRADYKMRKFEDRKRDAEDTMREVKDRFREDKARIHAEARARNEPEINWVDSEDEDTLLKLAIAENDPTTATAAQRKLGRLYEMTNNTATAAEWYTKAATGEPGDASANAQNNLGVLYHYGNGVARNPITAAYWYTKAIEQGHAIAERNLRRLNEREASE